MAKRRPVPSISELSILQWHLEKGVPLEPEAVATCSYCRKSIYENDDYAYCTAQRSEWQDVALYYACNKCATKAGLTW